jgi:hypothetical protein
VKAIRLARAFVLSAVMMFPLVTTQRVVAADVSVGVQISSVNDFYEPLGTQGYWVDVGSYGRCWHPNSVDATWRPYCEGTWVSTDDGWYWQSGEAWGWATYHYGRWAQDPYYGWCWVPDTTWGPSWVCFREGGGYCGWAPLPPGALFGANGEIALGIGVVPDNWFVFVGERHFGEHVHVGAVIVNNRAIIGRTTINTRIRRENNRVVNEGPRVQDLQKINHERIQTSTVQTLRQHEKTPPIAHRAVTQPAVQRENERPVKEAPEPERRPEKAPEIIRGPPSTPEPPAEHREQVQPRPPAEPPPHEGAASPPQRQAPPPEEHREAPSQENRGEEHGGGHEGEPGR